MTSRGYWSRRDALAGLGLLASPRRAFAQPEPDAGAFLETAFDAARRVTVPVYLDHQGPFPFVVDTGANHSVVSAEVAAACSLPVSGTAMVHGIVSLQPAPEVKVAHIRVGSVTSAGLRLPAIPRAQLGCAGILGLDMLRNRRIVLGFRDQSFEIAPSSSRTSVGSGSNSRIASPYAPVTVPARYRNGQLVIIDAEACGQGITAFLDSGSQVTIANRALRDLAVGARAEVGAQIFHSMLVSATGQRVDAQFAALPGLRLGGQLLADPLVAFADLHIFDLWNLQDRPTILIGVDILRRFDQVAFDFGRKRITFWPARRPAR